MMKKLLYIVGIVLIIFSLTGCKKMNKNAFKEGYSTNIKDERDLEELKSILNSNELNNVFPESTEPYTGQAPPAANTQTNNEATTNEESGKDRRED